MKFLFSFFLFFFFLCLNFCFLCSWETDITRKKKNKRKSPLLEVLNYYEGQRNIDMFQQLTSCKPRMILLYKNVYSHSQVMQEIIDMFLQLTSCKPLMILPYKNIYYHSQVMQEIITCPDPKLSNRPINIRH